jgi:phosphoribosyl-AMP cyclohydrolase / phosphoribosyl-ATP pyrophosphohydrolase
MKIDFQKYPDRLVPAIVQDARTQRVLMLGYMSEESLDRTQAEGKVTFYSRSRKRLWTKGETSGNYLGVEEVLTDCDSDAILIKATPFGPVCHTGADTCFGEENEHDDFLFVLAEVIKDRKIDPKEDSYTSKLFAKGLNRIAQKVGEEAVELVIESKDSNDERFKQEAADLLYHMLVLFAEKNIELREVMETLKLRAKR